MSIPELSRVQWKRSTYTGQQGNCVEVATLERGVAVRDSKHPDDAALMFTNKEWECFINGVKDGEFDLG